MWGRDEVSLLLFHRLPSEIMLAGFYGRDPTQPDLRAVHRTLDCSADASVSLRKRAHRISIYILRKLVPLLRMFMTEKRGARAMNEQLFNHVQKLRASMTERKETIQRLACDTPPEAVKVSEWMENWLGNISLEHRRVLERRLQLNDYGRFAETYFELIVFTSFHRLNCHIEVHPCFEETDSTVDFCVTHGAERFYTEATVCGISRGTLYSNTNEKDAIRRIKESVAKPIRMFFCMRKEIL